MCPACRRPRPRGTGNLTDYCKKCSFLQEAGALDLDADAYVHNLDENRST